MTFAMLVRKFVLVLLYERYGWLQKSITLADKYNSEIIVYRDGQIGL